MNIQDTEYAPAGDMFEMGAKVQVLKKGLFFPARANKLFSLYSNYDSLDDIPEKMKTQLQQNFFKKSFADIWDETRAYLQSRGQGTEIQKAEANPKQKMALIFRWYFGYSSKLTFQNQCDDKVNCQIHTGPALGSFNQWIKGSAIEGWRQRHVDEIALRMMEETANYLSASLLSLSCNVELAA